MDSAAVASETSVRRPKRGRPRKSPAEPSEEVAPSKTSDEKSNAAAERNEGFVEDDDGEDKRAEDEEDGDDFEDEPTPKRKRRGRPSNKVVDWSEDRSLIDVIKNNSKLIPHAVKKWVERYESDPKTAMVEILSTLFEACGAKYKFDVDSVDETNVDDVVYALVELARNSELEDNYNSKQKELKNFKENLALFWDTLVLESQNGPLFDNTLFEKCMDYIIALSCTPPRVYRQVASLVGLQLVTSFITVAKTLGSKRETTQRQLNAEKKKRNNGPRIESLNKRLSSAHEMITSIEEMMRKIFKGLYMHRYRDVDPDIRMSCIKSLGIWILSYPSLFLQDLYLKYLGWTLNDKTAAVRKTSILALQNLYEVDDNVPSLGLFTERFRNRMIELADDIDVSVAVSAIGLLKLLLRHQLVTDDELGSLYDLLIDEPPMIRRAVGELLYDHLIAPKVKGGSNDSSEVHLGRMLHILREFPDDPILISYVIDDVWDDMMAMRDWKCIISMLLDENPLVEHTDVDATNLVRLLYASARKAVGEKIVPVTDNRKQYNTKAQKDALETNRREITTALIKRYPKLIRKYIADKAKISPLVEMVVLLKLELYSLKRQEENFKSIIQLITEAFFKHGEKDTLRSCIKAINFCSAESQGDLQDYAENKLKDLENELIDKLKGAIMEVMAGNDEYLLLVNLKRLYELQLTKHVFHDGLYEEMVSIVKDVKDLDHEVVSFLLLNLYLHISWCLQSIHNDNFSESSITSLLSKRTTLFELLEHITDALLEVHKEGKGGAILSSRVSVILAEMWCLFEKSRFISTKLERLGYTPAVSMVKKFWNLCEMQLRISDDTEDEDANEEYIEETNRDTIMIAAAKLVASNAVPKDYLGPEIISHFGMHEASTAEIIKHLISVLKKNGSDDLPTIFLEALKRAYIRQMMNGEISSSKTLSDCKDLAARLSGTFVGAARNKYKSDILRLVNDGITFAFLAAPKHLSFLESAVLPFVSKLPSLDILEILRDVERRIEGVNTDVDPSGWRPYHVFVEYLKEKCAKNDVMQDDKEGNSARRRGRPRKVRNIAGKKLFEGDESSDEDSISASDQDDEHEEDDEEDEQQPLIHTFRASAAKLRSLKLSQPETSGQTRTSKINGSNV